MTSEIEAAAGLGDPNDPNTILILRDRTRIPIQTPIASTELQARIIPEDAEDSPANRNLNPEDEAPPEDEQIREAPATIDNAPIIPPVNIPIDIPDKI